MKNRILHYLLKDKDNYEKDKQLSEDWEIFEYYLSHVRQMSWFLIKKKILYFLQYKKLYLLKLSILTASIIAGVFFGGRYILNNNPFIEIKRAVSINVENIYCPDTINVESYLERLSRISGRSKEHILSKTNIIVTFTEDSTKTFDKWLKSLGYLESRNTINAENGQYWGEWQLGKSARDAAGFGDWNKSDFLSSRDVQVLAVKRYTQKNYEILAPYIKKYNNRILRTYHLTESGLLAMSHNCGPQGVIDFLNSGGTYLPKDGNGVLSTNYLTLGNYNIMKEILSQ